MEVEQEYLVQRSLLRCVGDHSPVPAHRRPEEFGLRRRGRAMTRWGWVGTGLPENLAVFTLTPPLRDPLSEPRALDLCLEEGTGKLTSIHLFYQGLLKRLELQWGL